METNPGQSQNAPSTPEKPARSKLERAIVWTLIGLLIVFTAVEAISKSGYEKTLANLQDAIDTSTEPLTMQTFHSDMKWGVPIQSTGEKEGVETILFTWPSLVKTYQLHFTVASDGSEKLVTYATGQDPAAGIPEPRIAGEEPEFQDTDIGGDLPMDSPTSEPAPSESETETRPQRPE